MSVAPSPGYDPGRIGNPVQLLAAFFLTMTSIVVAFLSTAAIVQTPSWALALLISLAGASVPIFGAGLFIMLAKFRHVLLGDEDYLRWLDMTRRKFRGFRPRLQGDAGVIADTKLAVDADLSDFEKRRRSRYEANQGMFLAYDWRPSVNPGQLADITVRLQQHISNQGDSGPFARGEVNEVRYYLGPQFFEGRAVVARDMKDGFRLDLSAYSPVLCIAEVRLGDQQQPIWLEQYLAFGE